MASARSSIVSGRLLSGAVLRALPFISIPYIGGRAPDHPGDRRKFIRIVAHPASPLLDLAAGFARKVCGLARVAACSVEFGMTAPQVTHSASAPLSERRSRKTLPLQFPQLSGMARASSVGWVAAAA